MAYYTTYASIRHRLPYASFHNFLVSHASSFKRWWVDPRSSISIIQALGSDKVFLHRSVVQEMKEIKNGIEIAGMREAHARDCGAAVTPDISVVVNVSVTYLVGWRIKFTLVRWSRNQMYQISLHSFRSTSYLEGGLVMVDNGCIILDPRLRLWRVPQSTLRPWNMSLIQTLVPTLPKTQCSCSTQVQITSFFPSLRGNVNGQGRNYRFHSNNSLWPSHRSGTRNIYSPSQGDASHRSNFIS